MDGSKEQIAVELLELQKLARCIATTTSELTLEMLLYGNNDYAFLGAIKCLTEAQAATVCRLTQHTAAHYMTARLSAQTLKLNSKDVRVKNYSPASADQQV